MNTYLPYTTVTETYTFPSTPDVGTATAEVTFDETDDTVASSISLLSGSQYQVIVPDDNVNSAGTYSIKWGCEISGSPFYSFTSFSVVDVYSNSTSFFDEYPEYDNGEFHVVFDRSEALARRIIDTYTGQDFQFMKDKQFTFEGNGKNKLYVTNRLNSFTSVTVGEADYTDLTALDIRSKHFIRIKTSEDGAPSYSTFKDGAEVKVRGDWGWRDVPWEIRQATELLIVDILDDTRREHKRYGIQRLWQDTNRLEFHPSIFSSTGNTDVDTLLMDYVIWTMDYVT